jgi:cytidylate kinase
MDGRRAEYIRRLFGVDWLDATHYDLSIDTGRVDTATAVDIIELVARRRTKGTSAS